MIKKAPLFFALAFLLGSALVLPHAVFAQEDEKPQASEPKKDAGEGKEEGGKSKGPTDVTGGRFAGDPVYVHLDPLVLPVVTDEGAEQLVTFLIDVEVKDFDAADMMHTNMPRVRDALVRALYGGLSKGTLRIGKMMDVDKIRAKATVALQEVVGADNIRNVLIQNIAQRVL